MTGEHRVQSIGHVTRSSVQYASVDSARLTDTAAMCLLRLFVAELERIIEIIVALRTLEHRRSVIESRYV